MSRLAVVLIAIVTLGACAGAPSKPQPLRPPVMDTAALAVARRDMAPARVSVGGAGRYVVVLPPRWKKNSHEAGVVYLHSFGADAKEVVGMDTTGREVRPFVAAAAREIALSGLPVVSTNAAGDSWGNDKGLAQVSAAAAYLADTVGARGGRVLVMGLSMGGQIGLLWAARNPKKVAGLVGVVPVSDLEDVYVADRAGARPAIDTALGGPNLPAARLADRSPLALALKGKLRSVDMQLWYGTDDTIAVPSTVEALASAVGRTAVARAIPGNHYTAALGMPIYVIAGYLVSRSRQ